MIGIFSSRWNCTPMNQSDLRIRPFALHCCSLRSSKRRWCRAGWSGLISDARGVVRYKQPEIDKNQVESYNDLVTLLSGVEVMSFRTGLKL
jgi:hypothetical protein